MVTHSSTLAWRIPWTDEPGRLQSIGSQRAEHNWAPLHTSRTPPWNLLSEICPAWPSTTVFPPPSTARDFLQHWFLRFSPPNEIYRCFIRPPELTWYEVLTDISVLSQMNTLILLLFNRNKNSTKFFSKKGSETQNTGGKSGSWQVPTHIVYTANCTQQQHQPWL